MKIAGKAVAALLLAALIVVMLPMSAFAAEDGKVWLSVSEDEGTTALIVADTLVTDGLVVVTYDSEKLTYVGVETEEAYVAMHAVNTDEPGVVKISWVAPGPYETDGSAFCLIRVLFTGVENESTMVLTGAAHNADGDEIAVGEGPDTTELEKAILEAEGLDGADYTEESFAVLEDALAAAEEVLEDGTATQKQIDVATKTLRDAINALELKPEETEPEGTEPEETEPVVTEPVASVDKDELKKAIAVAEGLNSDKYTEDSFEAVKTSLADAKEVLDDENATQEQVDAAAKALRDAIAALELIPTVTPGTGDETMVGVFAMLALISAAALVVMNKRRAAR